MKDKTLRMAAMILWSLCLLIPATASATNYTLNVSTQGSGAVTKNPTNASYPSGVVVTLTATPANGWYFDHWSGDLAGTNNPVNVTMNSNLVITGNFLAYPTYSLSLVTNGQGTIDLNPPGGSYYSNSVVTATATPTPGWLFTGWFGDTNSTINPLTFPLDANLSLTGNFAELPAIDQQPVSVTNAVGSTVSFSAHAIGSPTLRSQWFSSVGSLPNATNTTLNLTNVTTGRAGKYWIVITNNYGSATSQMASLIITNASGPTNVVNVADEASLRKAISIGGWIGLGFNGTLTLTNTINITNDVILDGSGVSAVISGGNVLRLFYIAPGASFSATNLTLANGSRVITDNTDNAEGMNADAGAIYNDGGTVTLVACTLTNNTAQALIYGGVARGGAIYNNGGTLSLSQSLVTSNSVVGGGFNSYVGTATNDLALGGAIYNTNGAVTISGCTVSGNLSTGVCEGNPINPAFGLAMGGAAFQSSGSMTIVNSSFAANVATGTGVGDFPVPGSPVYGGALAVITGSLSIDHGQFFANTAKGGTAVFHSMAGSAYGGAVYSAATLTVRDCAFFGNQSLAGSSTIVPQGGSKGADGLGGAIYNAGNALLNRCSVCSNYVQGGSAFGYEPIGSAANGGNGFGGGIFNGSQLTATNCTLSLNSANGGNGDGAGAGGPFGAGGNAMGGGMFNDAGAMFIAMNLTVASNSCNSPVGNYVTNGLAAGNQIANTNGTVHLHNSILAYAGTNSNAYGIITDNGYNISSDGSANLSSGSSYNFTDPQLSPLANYGGPTLTMALLPGSPAIDSADSSDFPATDQRGYIRPFGPGPDIGAYEYGAGQSATVQLNIIPTASSFIVLSYTTTMPGLYLTQASTNLAAWTDLSTNGPFASQTNVFQVISQQGYPTRFFRLRVQ